MRLNRPFRLLPLAVCLSASSLSAQVLVTLSTSSNSLSSGQNAVLTAVCTAPSGNTGVKWSMSPQVGDLGVGNNLSGTSITTTNNYAAPATITQRQTVTITATSNQDPNKSASVTIQLSPAAITVSPATVSLNSAGSQQFTATGGGVATYQWSISPAVGAIDQTGLYSAPPTISASQTVTVTATSTADSTVSGTARITLTPTATVAITISPATASLIAGQSQQFSATVTNASSTAVIWSLSPATGSIDQTGLYTAPLSVATTTTVKVTATAAADTTKSATATVTLNTVVDVGSGAPSNLVLAFQSAYFRNGFNLLTSLPPVANVKRLGTTGYVQEFNDAAKSGAILALATLSASAPQSPDTTNLIAQLYADLYAYYKSVSAAAAGLPLYDTQNCPVFDGNSCTYDIFDKNYALFAYHTALATGQNFTIRNQFFTEWTARTGITGPGRPVDVETAVTAPSKVTATFQTYINGAIYVISSGVNNGKTFSVLEPIYNLYIASGGPGGSLGLPTSQEITLSSGVHRQTFEGGILEYTPGSGPTQRQAVNTLAIAGASTGVPVALNLGDSLTVSATPLAGDGTPLLDRPVTWSTSNSRVVSLEASGATAVLRAVGAGSAAVTATSEGVLSPKINLIVTAPCCQVGDGTPSNVQRSFQDALTRNNIAAQIPVAAPASRVGNGYVQVVQAANGSTYWLAESDAIGAAFVVGGLILQKYDSLGGPAGPLGYPVSDRSAGGTQRFENRAALAGNPVRLVSGGVLAKWAAQGYESGAAGAPTADASPFATFGANAGSGQGFTNGAIYAASSGPRGGQAYFVSGPILVRYLALGGPGGDFGMPASDEFITGGLHQQNFEGGNITWTVGDAAAAEHMAPKTPGVVASPGAVTAGGRAHIAAVGFAAGSALKISVTGQPDFTVTAAAGSYGWDLFFPVTAASANLTVTATDTRSGASASGTLAVKSFKDTRAVLSKVQGDNQTGVPSALLPLSLRVALRDASGNAVTGAAVTFAASSGSLTAVSAVSDAGGMAETWLRLPAQETVVLVNALASGVASSPVTFAVRAAATSLANFPRLQQAGSTAIGNGSAAIAQKGALLTAVASILRYHQNRSELPGPNGTADPAALNAFLKTDCAPDGAGNTTCDGFLSNPDSGEQVVNLWRAADFTGGADVEVAAPSPAAIADFVAAGSPALVSLGMSRNGVPAGGHYVVAIGVAADGSIVIQDPSPVFARASLNDYLGGFAVGGDAWKADLRGVARFALRNPGATRFLAAALSQPPAVVSALGLGVASAAGNCGTAIDLADAVDPTAPAAGGMLVSRMLVCDGAQSTYQLQVGAGLAFRALVDDLATGGSLFDVSGAQAATYKLTRPKLTLAVAPQDVSFQAAAVVGGATFTPGIAPGGVVSIFGSGLAGAGAATSLDLDGTPMRVLFATPFQINAEVPAGTAPGTHTLRVQSAYGSAQQQVTVSALAPGIFLVGNPPLGAMTNTSYALIGPSNPLPRGQTLIVFATGLGAVQASGGLMTTAMPVTAVVNGAELAVQYAGLAPGYPGLYQVNVLIPGNTPPGVGLTFALKVGGQSSNAVTLVLQ
ncbi:MAG: hypothetical protein JST11_22545 [Acidobacteria bacterium]|nr:hypothetical protein [Acidobacteriota bacterium]